MLLVLVLVPWRMKLLKVRLKYAQRDVYSIQCIESCNSRIELNQGVCCVNPPQNSTQPCTAAHSSTITVPCITSYCTQDPYCTVRGHDGHNY